MTEFGKTWWGEHWLKSLSDIDYSNRLPRGRTYARNGSVKDIVIEKNRVNAKVQGRRPAPYKIDITVAEFTTAQKQKIINAVQASPLLLSKLLNREMPPELNKIAEDHKIKVFPATWKDFGMKCSCPDWAVPCKHLAAVIYILSSEIDKNPFIIFNLHGLDIVQELEDQGFEGGSEIKAPSASDFLITTPCSDPQIDRASPNLIFDFSVIPPMQAELFSLMEDTPLFYGKSFLRMLKKAYKAAARVAKETLDHTDRETPSARQFEQYESAEVILHNEVYYFDTVLYSLDDEKHFAVQKNGFAELISFLNSIPAKYSDRLCRPLFALYTAYHFSLKLAETGGIIPQILKLQDGSHIVRYIPAAVNEAVANLLAQLSEIIPPEMIKVFRTASQAFYLDSFERAVTLVQLFISHYFYSKAEFVLPKYPSVEDKCTGLFLAPDPQKFDRLGEKEIPGSVYKWLSRFYIAQKDYVPVLKINDQGDNCFSVEIFVENRKDSLQGLIALREFIENRQYGRQRPALLHSLATLSHYFPDLDTLTSSLGDSTLAYDSEGFADVLLGILPVIKLLGIRLLLPNALKTLVRPKASFMLQHKESTGKERGFLSIDQLLDFEWRVAIGDKTVSVKEFLKLVKGMSGVVKIKGSYVLLDKNEIERLLKNLKAEKALSGNELLKAALSQEYQEAKISISKEARKIIDDLLQLEQIPPPSTLKGTLRPYQVRGYQWLYSNTRAGFGSIIADDMGLGKTIQVIALLLKMKAEKALSKQGALVVVPTTLVTNWEKELQRFAPSLSRWVYHGTGRKLPDSPVDILLTTYGMLRSDAAKLQKPKWAAVIIDEAQNIKNVVTEQTKAVKKLNASVKIAMSGTPVENRLSEYWSIFDFTNKGYLGSVKYFKQEFASPIEIFNDEKQLDTFRKITAPFILRRLKTDKKIITDLPEKIEQDTFVTLTKQQTALYQNVVETLLPGVAAAEDDSIKRAGLVFKLITALKQICNHPSQFLKKDDFASDLSGKTVLLLELLQSIYESNEKVLVFSQYREMGEILKNIIEQHFGNHLLFLHGGVSRKKRDEMVTDFQEKNIFKTFLLSIKAGGTGLNLTEANHVIHFDLWWNPAVESQATDRAFRIGQKKNVMVYRMITQGTFEEKINDMLLKKKDLANLAVSAGEQWIGNLSNKELEALIKL